MKIFVVVIVVDGLFSQAETRKTFGAAVADAAIIGAGQCGNSEGLIRAELEVNKSFTSSLDCGGEVQITIAECELTD